jgi:N6-adenosine-specific RNA methylase IME4
MLDIVKANNPVATRRKIEAMRIAIMKENDPAKVVKMLLATDVLEDMMRSAGLYDTKEIRPANEARFEARWKLGQLLAKVERSEHAGPGRGHKKTISSTSKWFSEYINDIGLDKDRASQVQRIGAIPDELRLRKAFREAEESDVLNTVRGMIEFARPWFKIETRKKKHRAVQDAVQVNDEVLGPFTLLYADPPWQFDVYSEAGEGRSAVQHYPTMSDDDIANFKINGRRVMEVMHDDAALFLWCTSSNIDLALDVMDAWGFQFRSSAVWVKDKIGTGYIFRNKHELLLYGVRGKMPAPVFVPPSVFELPRGKHSAKPSEIRGVLELMYPYVEEKQRLELFARGSVPLWTTFGFETTK